MHASHGRWCITSKKVVKKNAAASGKKAEGCSTAPEGCAAAVQRWVAKLGVGLGGGLGVVRKPKRGVSRSVSRTQEVSQVLHQREKPRCILT